MAKKQEFPWEKLNYARSRGHSSSLERLGCFQDPGFLVRTQSVTGRRRSTSALGISPVAGVSRPQLQQLFAARCADLGLSPLPDQEARFLSACRRLFVNRKVGLKDCGLGVASAKVLGQVLAGNLHFYSVTVAANALKDAGATLLTKRLRANTALVHLDLSNTGLTPEGVSRVAKNLTNHVSLVSLNLASWEGLHRNRVGSKGSFALSKCLANNPLLTHLNLAGTNVTNKGLQLLSQGLQANSTLLSLNLASNHLTNLRDLATALGKSHIEHLYLDHNPLNDPGWEELALQLLSGQCLLRSLNLAFTGGTAAGLGSLLTAVCRSPLLANLVLDGNDFSAGLPPDFLSFLQINHSLLSLSLANCRLGQVELTSFTGGLIANQSLKSLNLANNGLVSGRLKPFYAGLRKNTGLNKLNLAHNSLKVKPIQTAGGLELAACLKSGSRLESISLKATKLKDEAVAALIDAARVTGRLTVVKLQFNSVSPDVLAELTAVLARNHSHQQRTQVPVLRRKIRELTVDEIHKQALQCKMKRMRRLKRSLSQNRLVKSHWFEEVKAEEERKTQALKATRAQACAEFQAKSAELFQLQQTLAVAEVRQKQAVDVLFDQISALECTLKKAEKAKTQLLREIEAKQASSAGTLQALALELHKEQVGLRSASGALDSLKKRMGQLTSQKKIEPFYLASEKLATAKRVIPGKAIRAN